MVIQNINCILDSTNIGPILKILLYVVVYACSFIIRILRMNVGPGIGLKIECLVNTYLRTSVIELVLMI